MARISRARAAALQTKKLFVLDTNVLLHDPQCLFRFAEHDLFLPFVTLEELDGKKVGSTDVNRNARQATRLLDQIVTQPGALADGFALQGFNGGGARGRLYLQTELIPFLEHEHLKKNDNQYLAVLNHLLGKKTHRVVLVSKDINLRIKARALGFDAEDYKNDQVLEDLDVLARGWSHAPANLLSQADANLESWRKDGIAFYRLPNPAGAAYGVNEVLFIDELPFRVVKSDSGVLELAEVPRFDQKHKAVWGICAKNPGQLVALELLTDPNVDLVSLLGPAGTGKTLLALAAALEQVVEHRRYSEVIFTRATVPLGEDIGYLPGTEEEKMAPWLGALDDNLEVLLKTAGADSAWHASTTKEYVRTRIRIKAMTFMRGRTFNEKFLIIDEAQNLTAKQMKSLVTRAGHGTKVICLGNLSQIDTPYLTEASSGLTYLAERFRGWPHYGHVILEAGERSRLASHANECL